MDPATTEIVQEGIALETIVAPDLPDTESMLHELGVEYPIMSFPAEIAEE